MIAKKNQRSINYQDESIMRTMELPQQKTTTMEATRDPRRQLLSSSSHKRRCGATPPLPALALRRTKSMPAHLVGSDTGKPLFWFRRHPRNYHALSADEQRPPRPLFRLLRGRCDAVQPFLKDDTRNDSFETASTTLTDSDDLMMEHDGEEGSYNKYFVDSNNHNDETLVDYSDDEEEEEEEEETLRGLDFLDEERE